jgi:hypothetical protein
LAAGTTVAFAPLDVTFHVALGLSVAMGVSAVVLLGLVTFAIAGSRLATGTAVVIAAISAAVSLLVLNASMDVAYSAISLGAVLLTLRRRHGAAIATFMVAALLRPEAVLLALVPLALVFLKARKRDLPPEPGRLSQGRAAWTYVVGATIAACAWLTMGALGGDPLIALHSANSNAEVNSNPRGATTALTTALPGLAGAAGWVTVGAAATALLASAVALHRRRANAQDRATLTVGALIGVALVAYVAQGLAGTPLVARYLLLPALLCVAVAARCVALASRLTRRPRAGSILSIAVAALLVAAAAAANTTAWRDVAAARQIRAEAFNAGSELVQTDLAQDCAAPFVVRSPAVVALTALTLDRPLRDITVAGQAGTGVLLQPLTVEAAQLAGYGPMTPLEEQAMFPTDAPPRQSNAHWALYSSCQP